MSTLAMPRMIFTNPKVSDLVAGKIPADLCLKVGDFVRSVRGITGYFVITNIEDAIFDYDYWSNNGCSDYYSWYIHAERAKSNNISYKNPRQYFSILTLTKVATKSMKPLKSKRKGFEQYANKVEYVDKQILQDELDERIKTIKDQYTQLINTL